MPDPVSGLVGGAASGSALGPYGALAGGAMGLLQGMIGSNAASKASQQQLSMQRQAMELNKQRYAESQGNFSPYLQAGTSALGTYQNMLGNAQQPSFDYQQPAFNFDTYQDPGAQYQIAQANKAMQNSALARGMTGGGALASMAAKNQEMTGAAYSGAFDRYKQTSEMNYGQAQGTYQRDSDWLNNIMNRYGGLASSGQQAAGTLGNIGAGNAAAMTNLYTGMGETQAQGTLGSANAMNSGLGQFVQGIGQFSGMGGAGGQVNNNLGGQP